MAYQKKTWIDQNSEYPQRRRLTDADTGAVTLVDVERAEGAIETAGDRFDSETMNSMETRIANSQAEQDTAITKAQKSADDAQTSADRAQSTADKNTSDLATLRQDHEQLADDVTALDQIVVKRVNMVSPVNNNVTVTGNETSGGTISVPGTVSEPISGEFINTMIGKLIATNRNQTGRIEDLEDVLAPVQVTNLLQNPNNWGFPGGITGGDSFKIWFNSSASGLPNGWGASAGSGIFIRQTSAGDGFVIITRDNSNINGNSVEYAWKLWNDGGFYWSPWRTLGSDIGNSGAGGSFTNAYITNLYLNGTKIPDLINWTTRSYA